MSRDAPAYRDQMIALLPPGRAWTRDPEATLGRLLLAIGDEFARVDARFGDLIEEADPRTTLELLPDWERVAALPDTCTASPDAIRERQLALANKLAQTGGQSIPYFVALAARLGYLIEIDEFTSFDAGAGCGADLNSDDWRHAWRVNVYIGATDYMDGYAEFCAGSLAGDRLIGFGALNLECLINRARPAQSALIFAYIIEPDPVLWFSFV